MEVIFFSVLFLSVAGNILSTYILYDLLKKNVSGPKQLYNERKDGLLPFVTPMKEADQVDLSEIDDEVLKESIKKTITNNEVQVDDEEVAAKAKEFLT